VRLHDAMRLAPALILLAAAAGQHCEDWCIHPCEELNGDPEYECGGCESEDYACRLSTISAAADSAAVLPLGATRQVDQRRRALSANTEGNAADHESVPIGDSAALSEREPLPCQRLRKEEVESLSIAQRTAVFARPTLVSGLIDHWPALRNWSDAAGFTRDFGSHGVLAKRAGRHAQFRTTASRQDPTTTLVSIAEALEQPQDMHVVLYNHEHGNANAEEDFLEALRASGGFDCPSGALARACGTLVLSLGGAQEGVRMANHGLAWIGLIGGMKLWHVAPHDAPRPPNPTCGARDRIEVLPGVTHCLQHPGEVMVVPTAWWHATCNLGEYTLGIGGQDSCDLVDCTPPGPPDEDPHELHMRKEFCLSPARSEQCNGPAGATQASHHRESLLRELASGIRPWTLEREEWVRERSRAAREN
jgi:hypothetical protein